jgi:drug/metabolite transporter (DMT)-like permease
MLIGVLFLAARPSRVEQWQFAFGVAGVAVILFSLAPSTKALPHNAVGVAMALVSGLTYAGVVMFLRWLRDENAAWLISLNLLITAALLLPYVVYIAVVDGLYPSTRQLAVLAAFGALQIGLPYLLFAYGLKNVASQLWVLLAWGERPAPATIAGAALILTGLALRYAPPRSKWRMLAKSMVGRYNGGK